MTLKIKLPFLVLSATKVLFNMVQSICFSESSDGKSIAFPKRDEKIENSEQFELCYLENFCQISF